MRTIHTLLAASILAATGAANAATVGTFDYSSSGAISGPSLGVTGTSSGSGSAVLDDTANTLTLTGSSAISTNLGGAQNVTDTTVFNGAYAGGVFTASSGSQTVSSCSGACGSVTLNSPSAFSTVTGTVAASATGGALHTTSTQFNGLVSVANDITFSNFQGTTTTPPAVPIPAAAWLFGSALMGLAGTARRRLAS